MKNSRRILIEREEKGNRKEQMGGELYANGGFWGLYQSRNKA